MAISIGFFDNEPLGYPIIPFPAPERVGKKERHPSAQRKSSRTTGGQPCEGEARLLSYVMLKGRCSLWTGRTASLLAFLDDLNKWLTEQDLPWDWTHPWNTEFLGSLLQYWIYLLSMKKNVLLHAHWCTMNVMIDMFGSWPCGGGITCNSGMWKSTDPNPTFHWRALGLSPEAGVNKWTSQKNWRSKKHQKISGLYYPNSPTSALQASSLLGRREPVRLGGSAATGLRSMALMVLMAPMAPVVNTMASGWLEMWMFISPQKMWYLPRLGQVWNAGKISSTSWVQGPSWDSAADRLRKPQSTISSCKCVRRK